MSELDMTVTAVNCRLVCRATVEERMMQQSKKKLVLEHLVVERMRTHTDVKQQELDDLLRYGAEELFAEGGEGGGAGRSTGLMTVDQREQLEGRTGGQSGAMATVCVPACVAAAVCVPACVTLIMLVRLWCADDHCV